MYSLILVKYIRGVKYKNLDDFFIWFWVYVYYFVNVMVLEIL